MSNRVVVRELTHALADLNHEAFPDYASAWQDDILCAAEHIKRAHEAMTAWVATFEQGKP
jgi:hypothetical protein